MLNFPENITVTYNIQTNAHFAIKMAQIFFVAPNDRLCMVVTITADELIEKWTVMWPETASLLKKIKSVHRHIQWLIIIEHSHTCKLWSQYNHQTPLFKLEAWTIYKSQISPTMPSCDTSHYKQKLTNMRILIYHRHLILNEQNILSNNKT